jgi:chromosome segregation ATPase
MRANVILLTAAAAYLLFLTSCASSVSVEEFETYRTATQQELVQLQTTVSAIQTDVTLRAEQETVQAMQSQVDQLQNQLNQLQNRVATVSETEHLKQELQALSSDYHVLRKAIDDFVTVAGYNDPDDLLRIGSDIIKVNANIAQLNKRLDTLRSAMELFVREP